MERTSLRRDKIIRDKWESNSLILEGDNLQASHGFSSSPIIWPHQRNYTCRFCKRDFNSAQALGGHMNVHRRDRAMLRQLPPSFVFKQNLTKSNPSFLNFSSCSSSLTNLPLPPPKYLVPYSHTGLSLASPSPSPRHGKKCTTFSPPIEELKKDKSIRRSNLELLVGEFNEGSAKKFFLDHQEVLKEDDHHREVVSSDLEMGFEDPKEVLDLELRLGCF